MLGFRLEALLNSVCVVVQNVRVPAQRICGTAATAQGAVGHREAVEGEPAEARSQGGVAPAGHAILPR